MVRERTASKKEVSRTQVLLFRWHDYCVVMSGEVVWCGQWAVRQL